MPKHILEEDVAGICVQDGLISASRLAVSSDGRVRLRSVGWTEYDRSASDDDLSSAIRHAWRHYRMPTRTVVGCMNSESIQYRYFRYENLGEEELGPALVLEAEELLKLPRAGIAMDWHLFESSQEDGSSGRRPRLLEGILVAVPRRELDRHYYILKHAGLYTVILDIGPLATANLFRVLRPSTTERDSVCLLDVSTDYAHMVVMGPHGFAYPRSVRSYSAPWEEASEYLAESAADVLRHVRFSLRKAPVRHIYLTGRAGGRTALASLLAERLGVPVTPWNPLDEIADHWPHHLRSDTVRHDVGPWLSAALGLGLRGASREDV